MAPDFLAYLGWREALIAVVALLVVYILISFLRIGRLKNRAVQERSTAAHAAPAAVAAYTAVQEVDNPPPKPVEEVPVATALPEKPRERTFAWNEPPEVSVDTRRIEVLEQEVAQLRREIGGLLAEVQTLRDEQQRELAKVQENVQAKVQSTVLVQNTSPYYSDAMQLAQQGQDAAGISQLCGISRAEADLVVALARNQGQGQDQEREQTRDYGGPHD